jgi:carbonic anhydrase/acetyltransferase-like protein (isoleucine patch superfamily)
VSEKEILHCPEKKLKKELGASAADLKPTLKPAHIGAEATVSPTAWIGPGVQVLGKSVIKDNVRLFRTVVKDSVIEDGACFYNSVIEKSKAGSRVQGRCVLLRSSKIGSGSVADCARIEKSDLAERSTLYPFAHVTDSTIENPCIVGTTVKNADVRSFLMTYHMPGYAENLDVEPVEITYEGQTHAIRIIPMLGGGMRILGRKGKRVSVSCSFVGSNAIIEAGAYIGFGCFVLGRLSGAEGLPPFTLSTEAGPEKDQIGAVASNFPHIIISHFIQWTYQSNGIDQADSVARMVPCMLSEGRNAVHAEIERRTAGKRAHDNKSFGRYKSLKLYTLEQLKAGLDTYDNELSDGRWLMKYVDGELRFSGSGKWTITDGAARWEKA